MLHTFETGELTLDEYLRRTVFYRPRPFTPEEFKTFMFEQSQPFPESLAFLGALAQTRRYMLAALNNESLEINEYRIAKFKLRDYFEAFSVRAISACASRERKFTTARFKSRSASPQECVLIDDRGLNLECAQEMGMHTIQFHNVASASGRPRAFRSHDERKKLRTGGNSMELGMIGLGKMGGFMTERLVRGGHRVVGFDRDAAAVQRRCGQGSGRRGFSRKADRRS